MKDIFRLSLTLTIVALISAGSLSWINEITKSEILTQEEKDLNNALMYVLPGFNSDNIIPIQQDNQVLYYEGYGDPSKTRIDGYAFMVESHGYSSIIRTLVGIDTNGTILQIKILSQQETPGLGSRCQEIRNGESVPWWQAQFENLEIDSVTIDKDGGSIETITGATITSRAITDSIAKKIQFLLDSVNNTMTDNTDKEGV